MTWLTPEQAAEKKRKADKEPWGTDWLKITLAKRAKKRAAGRARMAKDKAKRDAIRARRRARKLSA